jgi:hypothetical protein
MRESLPPQHDSGTPSALLHLGESQKDRPQEASTIRIGGRTYSATDIKLRLNELEEYAQNLSDQHEVTTKRLDAMQKELAAVKAACVQGANQLDVAAEYILFEAAADKGMNLRRDSKGDYTHAHTFQQFIGWLKARGATPALAATISSMES